VGKTEVAKTLARFLFGSTSRLSRFDMSEYMDPLAAERLIRGTQRDEGELTRRVRQQPFCVVLLDEIEKAHRAVFDLLLQVCGEGRLSDARGRTTWFHNAIIIMTSNLGAAHRRPATGFGAAEKSDDAAYFLEQVERNFRPEFVNRLDRVVSFASLTREEIRQVSRVAVDRIREREGISLRGITLEVSDAALDRLARDGFSDAYGARALRRHLEAALVGPLSDALSTNARQAQLARIDVTTADDAAPSTDPQLVELARHAAGPVQVLVRRPVAASARSSEHVLAFVGHLRRQARRCAAARPLAEMRERLEYMIAELAQPGADTIGRPVSAAAFDRIKRLLAGVDEALESIEAAEDLCVAAQVEGEDPSAYGDEALAAFTRFEHAWVEAVLGNDPADRITVMARPVGTRPAGRELFRRWLRGWLEHAHARGWEAIVHRFEDPETDVTWPSDYPWGPPRTRTWALERLEAADDEELGKQWRGVVLRLRGPLAGGLMLLELGVHRHGEGGDAEHVQVRMAAPVDQLSAEMWRSEALQLPKPPDPAATARVQAAREFLDEDSLRLPHLGQLFDVGLSDYWDNHMRIAFSILADKVAREED
jgi:ATP-dependent Clp protease ATP-binding subunit ClpC